MEDGLPPGLIKKLALVGVFLVAVMLLVGREEDPGVIGQIGEDGPDAIVQGNAPPENVRQPPEARAEPAQRPQQGSLSSWYAESVEPGPATPEPFVPQPQDDSHLINDARPITDTGRVIAIEPPLEAPPEPPPVEIVE